MNGETRMYFLNRPQEEYILTYPNIYARGLLFGTTFLEIGDDSTIKCDSSDFVAEINFKVKVYFRNFNLFLIIVRDIFRALTIAYQSIFTVNLLGNY